MRSSHAKFASILPVLLWLGMAVRPLHAADDIVVRSASAELRGAMLEFIVRADFPADDQMREALLAGATVDVDLEATLDRENRFWFDERLLNVSFLRELSWNAPSQRFVLRDADSGHQQTFAGLDQALAAAGRVDGWAVELPQPLEAGETYQIGVRARLRRGRMPNELRALTSWTRYWSRSEWYEWELPR